ncbi:MAG: hypothetical protein AMXMBFR84_43940 [Candidatus Hydrogenedentota bacterium]
MSEIPKASTPPRVLLVEDEVIQLEFLCRLLTKEGYICDSATTCAEGKRLFEKGRYACALVDLGLPDGNGLSLIEAFHEIDPCLVSVVLTGDSSVDTVVGTLRSGAFDFLAKPAGIETLQATLKRAMSHHQLLIERNELLQLLLEEREQLRERVEAATADIRAFAAATEVSNARLRTLLRLTQFAHTNYGEDQLLLQVVEELRRHLPVRAVAVCDVTRMRFAAVCVFENGGTEFISGESGQSQTSIDSVISQRDPGMLISSWLEQNTDLDVGQLQGFVFTQRYSNQTSFIVAIYSESDPAHDLSREEFLDMCAHFIGMEWERTGLLYHVAHQASLGNIAVELARNFVQPLTAIQTAADYVNEANPSPEVTEGMTIIQESVDRLRRQVQEYRKLSLQREDSVETVRLDEYVSQAIGMLTVAIQNRGVKIQTEFMDDCECILLNGTALARTFLDVVLGALREVEIGGNLALQLAAIGHDHVNFSVMYMAQRERGEGDSRGFASSSADVGIEPILQLAERTIHRCAGTLRMDRDDDGQTAIRIVLPRNATRTGEAWEAVR